MNSPLKICFVSFRFAKYHKPYNDLKKGVLRAACPSTIFQCECPLGCVLSQFLVYLVLLYDVL